MSALFDFKSLIIVIVLFICCCSYIRHLRPSMVNSKTEGFTGLFRKAAVIGDRLSPYVALACVISAITTLFFR
ncbi:hypothetical protein SteCoe_33077 [Stentor coeruleus]|uniref:Protein kish n=1 Tax=Stentor coeruleus TaxID=5963 RepID=A0A1R2AXK0_9CILI|nr:hypothetical protein SteCoe_33077 [Stentor coeruleus]